MLHSIIVTLDKVGIAMWNQNSLLNSKRWNGTFTYHFTRGDNWHNFDIKSGNLGYGWLHYGFIQNLKPKRVLVIGSRYGFTPAICALACHDNCKGEVDFVDAGYDYQKPQEKEMAWGGTGFWKHADIKKHFGKFSLNDYLNINIVTSMEFYRRNRRRSWEYIFIDGDHSYDGVKRDFNLFWPKLREGGILAIHDIFSPKSIMGTRAGVKKFWNELKRSREYRLIEIPGLCGMGLIQK